MKGCVMKISSAAIKDGNFEDKYGAKGTDFANKLPGIVHSL